MRALRTLFAARRCELPAPTAADGPPAGVFDDELLSRVYRRPVEVLAHPRTGAPLVLPRRAI
ncbi:hypothetical protein ACFO9E_19695 [Streptomyces maoxianensis]|uniref:Uncharacterized protein n=1 Tax=Streptomyces maoxianensis TaxID=1459942 RepID=A0ABV9GBN7_9ACTN